MEQLIKYGIYIYISYNGLPVKKIALETYNYETEKGKIYGFNIKADEVGFADAKSGGNNADNQGGNAGQPQNGDMSPFPDNFAPVPGDFEDDDLPF